MDDEFYRIAEFIAQQMPGRPFVLIVGGGPGADRDKIITSDMSEAELLDTFRAAVRVMENDGLLLRHKRTYRRRPDA